MTRASDSDELERLRSENRRLRAIQAEYEAARASLEESEARYRSVVTALDDGVVLHDHDGQIVAWNDSAERVLGLTGDQLRGRTSLDPSWRCVHPDGSPFPGNEHPGRRTLETGEPHHGVLMGVHKPDGSLSWISVNSRAIEQPGGMGRYSVVASFCDITARVAVEQELRQSEAELRRALANKEALLRELYHRTRNDLQVVRSMLAIRALRPEQHSVESVLREVGERIRAMELVHRMLYEAQDLTTVRFSEYVEELVPRIFGSRGVAPNRVRTQLSLVPVALPIETAIPLGLALVELVCNVLDHAFPDGREGRLSITLERSDAGELALTVADDGVGFPDGSPPKDTLGLSVVAKLVEHQLEGQVEHESGDGTRAILRFVPAPPPPTDPSSSA